MTKTFNCLSFLFLMITLFSCKKESLAPAIDFKYNFYPLALTNVLVYNVDSTDYSGFAGNPVNYKFQLKDSVASTFTDAVNNLAYRIERYKKNENETLWQYQKTISRTVKPRSAEELINNKIYIRMVFPTDLGATWNANSKNNSKENEFSITDILETYTQNNLQFANTIITHFEDKNLIEEDVITNIYAQNVGLISAEVRAVDLKFNTAEITNGYEYKMELVSFK